MVNGWWIRCATFLLSLAFSAVGQPLALGGALDVVAVVPGGASSPPFAACCSGHPWLCLSRWPGCVGLDLVYPTPLQLEQARYSSRRPLVVYESSPGIFGSLTAVLVFRYYLLVYLEHSIHADYATLFSRRMTFHDHEPGRASFCLCTPCTP